MTEEVRDAVLGNVGSMVVFAVGAQDADVFGRELNLPPKMVVDTWPYEARCRILDNDQIYLLTPPPPKAHGHGQKIIAYSRMHYGTERASLEARIERALSSKTPAKTPDSRRRQSTW